MTMIVGFISTLLSMLAGDLSAKFLHQVQPEKLAAYEWHFDTQSKADLVFFGGSNKKTQELKVQSRFQVCLVSWRITM